MVTIQLIPDEPQEDIFVVALMGVTGSGKSNFIQLLTDSGHLQGPIVGHNLDSCTQRTETFSCILRGRQFIFFDTPGFDDTYRGDAQVLADIAESLSTSYKNRLRLSGIIYLHRIKDEKMTNAIMRNLTMFRNLCGDDSFGNVLLVTTFWDELQDEAKGEWREQQLVQRPEWWGYMTAKGSRTRRFHNTKESALDILWDLVGLPPVTLQVQDEMAVQGLDVDGTKAGKALNQELSELRAAFEEQIAALRDEKEQARLEHDEQLQEILENMEAEKRAALKELENEQAALRADRREERRRMEQGFSDQLMRVQRERRFLHSKIEELETQSILEQEETRRRMDRILSEFGEVLRHLEKHKNQPGCEDGIAQLEQGRREIAERGEQWKADMERLTREMHKIQAEQKNASASQQPQLESKLSEIRKEKRSKTSLFWTCLGSLAGLGSLIVAVL